jgi:copper chaperone
MQTTQIKIEGMTCMGCVNSVKIVLEKISGVDNVDVSLEQAQATIQYDAETTSVDQFKQAIEDAGFDVVSM